MKKKWIAIGAIAGTLLLAVLSLAVAVVLRKDFFKKTDYDHIDATVYNDTAIVGEDGLFYLVRSGKKVSRGFTWLKSVNDYYTDLDNVLTQEESDLVLFEYYLAKDDSHSNYILVTPDGEELTIMGDGLTLEQVALPYLIFQSHSTSRQAVISLQALDSELSSRSSGELALLQTFSQVTPAKSNPLSSLYSHLYTVNTIDTKANRVYNARGAELLRAEAITPLTFYAKEDQPVLYWLDATANALYNDHGAKLSDGPAPLVFSVDRTWAYQLSTPIEEGAKPYITVISGNGFYTLSDDEYDLSTCAMIGNCLSITAKGKEGTVLIQAPEATQTLYQTLSVSQNGVLTATLKDVTDTIYLDQNGKELLRSPYGDMTVDTLLSSTACAVFRSAAYDAANNGTAYLHFTAPDKKATAATFESNQVLTRFATDDQAPLQDTFLITETTESGNLLYRIYDPFAVKTVSESYDRIQTFSQEGVYWSLGTSYERNVYDVLDPVNNQVAYSLSLKPEDFARLSFAFETSDVLATDPYDRESGVPTVIFSISRYEEKLNTVTQIRYFALYRQASVEDETFDGKTLICQEIGQNLLQSSSPSIVFYPKQNYLVIHTASGSRALRMNESRELVESHSLNFGIEGVLTDAKDPTVHYLRILSGVQDGLSGKKVGLVDAEGNVILTPYYDGIYHAEDGRFTVKLRNAFGVVSYKNGKVRELIDCQYSQVFPIGDGGYIAVDGNGHTYVYDKGRLLYDDALATTSYSLPFQTLQVIELDNESRPVVGSAVIINRKGSLYLHMPEHFQRMTPSSFDSFSSTLPSTIENTPAKLICYYDTAGSLIETQVILPTTAHETAFVTAFTAKQEEWFTSPVKEQQSAPITAGEILALQGPAIKLYQKIS